MKGIKQFSIITFLILGVGMVAFFWFKDLLQDRQQARWVGEAIIQHPKISFNEEGIVFQEQFPTFSVIELKPPLPLEKFLALAQNESLTDLARETFEEKVNGMEITWRLRVSNIERSKKESIRVRFNIPVTLEVVQKNSTSRSTRQVQIIGVFPLNQKENLLGIQKNDWVMVSGVLQHQNKATQITSASIVEDPSR